MSKMIAYGHQMREVFDLEAQGQKPEGFRSQAEWARIIAAEIRKQGMAHAKGVAQANAKLSPHTREGSFMTP
jgi:hypothetical protein